MQLACMRPAGTFYLAHSSPLNFFLIDLLYLLYFGVNKSLTYLISSHSISASDQKSRCNTLQSNFSDILR